MTTDRSGLLIWGAGAIGASVGAALAHGGMDVTFVDKATTHVEVMRDPARGLRISGPDRTFAMTVDARLPHEVSGQWSKILLCVKSQHTAAACRELLPHLSGQGYVVSLQNGLTEKIIAAHVGADRTIGAFVNFGADIMGPGEIQFGNRGAFVLGELDGRVTPRLQELLKIVQIFEPDAVVTSDIWSFLWGKLAYASLLFAQALGQRSIADSLAHPDLACLWRALAGEVVAVAHAEGVRPHGFNGFDPTAFSPGAEIVAAQRSISAMAAFNRASAKTHSGVWRDLSVHKRPTEVDAMMGAVVEIAARHNVPCPVLTRLVAMIHDVERGALTVSDSNLHMLAEAA